MTLVGLLSDYPLPELLFDLGARGRSGWLMICSDVREVEFSVRNGSVVSATTSDTRFRLGQRFLAAGQIRGGQLEAVLLEQRADQQKSTGELLVESGYVTESDVQRVLSDQIGDLLFRVLTNPDGCFSFQQGIVGSKSIPVEISLQRSTLQAIARADEWVSQQTKSTHVEFGADMTAAAIM